MEKKAQILIKKGFNEDYLKPNPRSPNL